MGNCGSVHRDSKDRHLHSSESHLKISLNQLAPTPRHRQKFSYIGDHFKTVDEVTDALRKAGLESSNLIVGIDFTKSNEWTGKYSFNRRSLHEIGHIPNPYEQAISIIGQTLSPFDEDNLIPCFGFGDASTHDCSIFSFYPDHRPCHGFEEALTRYRDIVPHLRLAGPTSFAPIIEVAMGIVEKSGGQYHVLVIVADGQVTRGSDVPLGGFSPQEQKTIDAIVAASQYPLSIVLVGVGDGPWDAMQQFDDNIPRRVFDNFQFVNFTKIMSNNMEPSEKEAAFALAALMEIPIQYKATQELHLLGRRLGNAPYVVPLPPPLPATQHDSANQTYPPHFSSFQNADLQSTGHELDFHPPHFSSFQNADLQSTGHEMDFQQQGNSDNQNQLEISFLACDSMTLYLKMIVQFAGGILETWLLVADIRLVETAVSNYLAAHYVVNP